ncbi:hypothetical protein [Methanothermobacter tenebrarum]|uniref:hypothetical protein n=1 Tax=Methanothermobacter tenebrarum TaxID=680118 RepID=UPI0015EC7933|nr:hypothetical protein [Methanothermobacter tenebrarum]NPV64442.1 hypothetical protein [Methanobacteriaceae archaeon]
MSEEKKYGSLAFVGCILVCMGIGLAVNRPDIGAIIGVGLGFLLMAIINAKTQK